MEKFLSLSALELAQKIARKEISVSRVIEAHIRHITKVNRELNALIADNFAQARQIAKEYDALLARGKKDLPPLFGVPCTVKGMFSVTGMPYTGGSLPRKDVIATSDATVVERLKLAGAIILGLTNVPEFGVWMESYNKLYGRTRNPYHPGRTSGGSSGGEAAIIGSGGSPFGIGSDGGGSIRMPAFFCGITGHKPSSGLIPMTGHLNVAGELSRYVVAGPMARKVEDLILLTQILAGPDGADPVVMKKHPLTPPILNPKKDIKIFYYDSIPGFRTANVVKKEINRVVEKLRDLGFRTEKFLPGELRVALDIFSASFDHLQEDSLSLAEIIQEARPVKLRSELLKMVMGRSIYTFPVLALLITQYWEGKKDITQISDILGKKSSLQQEITEELGENGVLIVPPFPRPAPRHYLSIMRPLEFIYSGIFNCLELPSTQVPTGFTSGGLPLGVQVVSLKYNDPLCWEVAKIIEQLFGGWKLPPSSLAKITSKIKFQPPS